MCVPLKVWVCMFIVVQSLSRVRLFVTPWAAARRTSLPFAISWSLLRLTSIEWVMPSNHLTLCCPFSGEESAYQCRRPGFDPCVLKVPWRRKWPSTPFLPGKSHGQRSLAGYSQLGRKELDTTEHLASSVYVWGCVSTWVNEWACGYESLSV